MSLDVAKLEKVRELAGGIVQARCPACAEGGHDRTGEHLRIYPDGRFGCCVHPKDGEHRKRIWALAGVRKPGIFSLRLKTPPALPPAQSLKAVFSAVNSGTPGTPENESENGVPSVPTPPVTDFGTLGTGVLELRACARVDCSTANMDIGEDFDGELKDLESGVPSVPTSLQPATGEKLPFLTAGGDLSIPFDSPERYHWWRGGQSVAQTLQEVKERMKNAITI